MSPSIETMSKKVNKPDPASELPPESVDFPALTESTPGSSATEAVGSGEAFKRAKAEASQPAQSPSNRTHQSILAGWIAEAVQQHAHRDPIHPIFNPLIKIMEAVKEPSHTSYQIEFRDVQVRRRYSDFEGLRAYLMAKYGYLIIPPIPDKQSLTSYANIPNKQKAEDKIIMTRKRMLQCFLNRVALHSILGQDHVFHLFLESSASWADMMHQEASIIDVMGGATTARSVKDVTATAMDLWKQTPPNDPAFRSCQDENDRTGDAMHTLVKSQRKLMKSYQELGVDMLDLGGALNGFSLEEKELSGSLERLGQAIDAHQAILSNMANYNEVFGDAVKELYQYSLCIKSTLKNHQAKIRSLDDLQEQLEAKQQLLAQLETPGLKKVTLMSQLTSSFQNMMASSGVSSSSATAESNDPDVSRRNNIEKTRESIRQLQYSLAKGKEDVEQFRALFDVELTRYKAQKIRDWQSLLVQYAKEQVQYHEQSLKTWKDAELAFDALHGSSQG